ncbi:MAG TPA: VOC family protein [Steroidobacteraceae bacterium]|jgi:2-polyprenyl-6-hydroxyphenyl methylase/3-demethylubiquinone-9 3-methyltransferase|nr:VOC family protein [Steroidobacteraceae bacterium]HNS26494.1 VOC family protein [Steroidobacteraceae bacterium]
MARTAPKTRICLWYDREAEEAANFYAGLFPDSRVLSVQRAPADYPSGKAGDVLVVEFTVLGVECGWCKDKWGVSWQITPLALTEAMASADPAVAKRVFEAMMTMRKIDIAAIEKARRG